jgi:pyruvate kinase
MLAKYRAELPLLVGSPSPTVVRQLNLSWGVAAFLIPSVRDTDALLRALLAGAKRTGVLRKGEPIVVISGSRAGAGGGANLVGLRTV